MGEGELIDDVLHRDADPQRATALCQFLKAFYPLGDHPFVPAVVDIAEMHHQILHLYLFTDGEGPGDDVHRLTALSFIHSANGEPPSPQSIGDVGVKGGMNGAHPQTRFFDGLGYLLYSGRIGEDLTDLVTFTL